MIEVPAWLVAADITLTLAIIAAALALWVRWSQAKRQLAHFAHATMLLARDLESDGPRCIERHPIDGTRCARKLGHEGACVVTVTERVEAA
jgi:hypothetical protein